MWMQAYLDEGDGIDQVSYENRVTGETRAGTASHTAGEDISGRGVLGSYAKRAITAG